MGEALALHWRLWALPYFASSAVAGIMAALVEMRGRGPMRRPLLYLLATVCATLFCTGTVFIAGDLPSAVFIIRFSQAVAVFNAPVAIEVAGALTGQPLGGLRRLAWGGAIVT